MKIIFIIAFILFFIMEIFLIIQYIVKKNKTLLKTNITLLTLFCFFLLAVKLLRLSIPYHILLFAMVALFINTFFGYYLNYFNRSKTFDRYLHGYGSFAFALLIYFILINLTESGGSKFFRAVLVAALGIATGAVYEIYEYAMDLKQSTNMPNMQRGLKDTDFDIVFDILGSFIAAVFAYFTFL